jgi:hypothetical protein
MKSAIGRGHAPSADERARHSVTKPKAQALRLVTSSSGCTALVARGPRPSFEPLRSGIEAVWFCHAQQ